MSNKPDPDQLLKDLDTILANENASRGALNAIAPLYRALEARVQGKPKKATEETIRRRVRSSEVDDILQQAQDVDEARKEGLDWESVTEVVVGVARVLLMKGVLGI